MVKLEIFKKVRDFIVLRNVFLVLDRLENVFNFGYGFFG